MDGNGLLGIAWHRPPLTGPAEPNAGPGLMSGRYAARKQYKGTSAQGRYAKLYIKQRIFSSAARRTMFDDGHNGRRRDGELKIACTKPLHRRWGYGN